MTLLNSYTPLGSFAHMEDPDAPGPCPCCPAGVALAYRNGATVWVCGVRGGYWVELAPEEPAAAADYAKYLAAREEEAARLRRLAAEQYLAHALRRDPRSWADIIEMDDAKRLASLSAEQRAAEVRRLEAAAEAQMADIVRASDASAIGRAAEAYAYRITQRVAPAAAPARRGPAAAAPRVHKRNCPCKNLFYNEKLVKPGQRAPLVPYVASECWAHEYTDPRDGKKKTPRTCQWLHPGEPGWLPQWNRDRNFKPQSGAAAAVAVQRGNGVWRGGFSALDEDDSD